MNVNDETNNTIIKERDEINISMVYNVFPE